MNTQVWLKGDTHVHSVRSDGHASVQELVDWYVGFGYDFLAVTDHNRYLTQRESGEVRVPPGFILIGGSELSYRCKATQKPVHVCDLGVCGSDPPGNSAVLVDGGPAQAADAALASASGLAVVNHPCWQWALAVSDMLAIKGRYPILEIWNSSADCNTVGIHGVDSPEDIWDKVLSEGLRIWGLAADDAHWLVSGGKERIAGGGFAWVRAGAAERSAAGILDAMRAGRFYASTGVELEEWTPGPHSYSLRVAQVKDRRYAIHLIGRHGSVLKVVNGIEASYRIRGDEGYVRARVEDTMGCRCWTQPWFA